MAIKLCKKKNNEQLNRLFKGKLFINDRDQTTWELQSFITDETGTRYAKLVKVDDPSHLFQSHLDAFQRYYTPITFEGSDKND